jgi:hypothetical protein
MDVIPRGREVPKLTDGAPTAPFATCAGCGAPLAPDQRYCLACGRPASPVRLAFLDVLQADRSQETLAFGEPRFGQPTAAIPTLPPDPPGVVGSLRRYSGLFGLLGVLLAALLIGLLVGHWLTGNTSPGKQVFEVKGLSGLAAAPAASTPAGGAGTSTESGSSASNGHHGGSTGSASSKSHNAAKSEGGVEESSAEEAKAAKEAAAPKALPKPKASPSAQKLAHTTGKQHAKEVKEQGDEPIETH